MTQKQANWNRDPPPSFQGLRDDLPLTCYSRHLPHWRQPGATYFVTSRLADSLPQEILRELEQLRVIILSQAKQYSSIKPSDLRNCKAESNHRETMIRIEQWLDQGYGECCFRRPEIATFVADALRNFDQERYELGAFVVMANHIHAIIRPYSRDDDALSAILHSRKRWIASNVNRMIGRQGVLWQDESFDRIIRDEEHLYRCIQYIGSNPRRAGQNPEDCHRWIQPSWQALGWDFEV